MLLNNKPWGYGVAWSSIAAWGRFLPEAVAPEAADPGSNRGSPILF